MDLFLFKYFNSNTFAFYYLDSHFEMSKIILDFDLEKYDMQQENASSVFSEDKQIFILL